MGKKRGPGEGTEGWRVAMELEETLRLRTLGGGIAQFWQLRLERNLLHNQYEEA